jgi:hypothetical protein
VGEVSVEDLVRNVQVALVTYLLDVTPEDSLVPFRRHAHHSYSSLAPTFPRWALPGPYPLYARATGQHDRSPTRGRHQGYRTLAGCGCVQLRRCQLYVVDLATLKGLAAEG